MTPTTTRFVAWNFTQAELFGATRFTEPQLMLLQSLLAQEAEKKLALKIDLTNKSRDEAVTEFIQREAAITGSMEAYEYLITLYTDTPAPENAEEAAKTADLIKPMAFNPNPRS